MAQAKGVRSLRLLPPDAYLGWTPYAWLIYLPIFLVQPAIEGASLLRWGLCAAGILVFLASYFRGYWVRDRGLVPVVVIQAALGLAFTPMNGGAYVFYIYAASFAALMEAKRESFVWIGIVFAAAMLAAWTFDVPLYYWIGAGVFIPLIAGVNFHFAGVQRSNTKLRLAHQEIEHLATVAERERIARDLHDVLGHTLSLIVLKAELASKLAERDPARAVEEIRDVEQVSRAALREVRDAISGYRPTLSDEVARARSLLDAARISTECAIDDLSLPREREEVIALALREAVTNVVRHSGASHAEIRIWREQGNALLEVRDDGRRKSSSEGARLRGMRERVESVGGVVSRAFENGMRLTVALPLTTP